MDIYKAKRRGATMKSGTIYIEYVMAQINETRKKSSNGRQKAAPNHDNLNPGPCVKARLNCVLDRLLFLGEESKQIKARHVLCGRNV